MTAIGYEPLGFQSREATLRSVAKGGPTAVARALLAAALESEDAALVEHLAVALSLHGEADVRRAAVLSLGHVARRFGAVNRAATTAVLDRLRDDPHMRGAVADVTDDLSIFLGDG